MDAVIGSEIEMPPRKRKREDSVPDNNVNIFGKPFQPTVMVIGAAVTLAVGLGGMWTMAKSAINEQIHIAMITEVSRIEALNKTAVDHGERLSNLEHSQQEILTGLASIKQIQVDMRDNVQQIKADIRDLSQNKRR
jgi:hypothetical protein